MYIGIHDMLLSTGIMLLVYCYWFVLLVCSTGMFYWYSSMLLVPVYMYVHIVVLINVIGTGIHVCTYS